MSYADFIISFVTKKCQKMQKTDKLTKVDNIKETNLPF